MRQDAGRADDCEDRTEAETSDMLRACDLCFGDRFGAGLVAFRAARRFEEAAEAVAAACAVVVW